MDEPARSSFDGGIESIGREGSPVPRRKRLGPTEIGIDNGRDGQPEPAKRLSVPAAHEAGSDNDRTLTGLRGHEAGGAPILTPASRREVSSSSVTLCPVWAE